MQTVTEDQSYNGWKNYPTWAVNLWLSNDEGLYNTVLGIIESVNELADETEDGAPPAGFRFDCAEAIKSFVRDDLAPDLGASFGSDLLGYALDQVDWLEIADAWLES